MHVSMLPLPCASGLPAGSLAPCCELFLVCISDVLWVPPNRWLARCCLVNLGYYCSLVFFWITSVHSMFVVPLALPPEYNTDHSRFSVRLPLLKPLRYAVICAGSAFEPNCSPQFPGYYSHCRCGWRLCTSMPYSVKSRNQPSTRDPIGRKFELKSTRPCSPLLLFTPMPDCVMHRLHPVRTNG